MKMKSKIALVILLATAAQCAAQTSWTNVGVDSSWSNTSNWSSGLLPTSTSDVTIGVRPQDGILGLDTGSNISIKSLTVSGGVGSFSVISGGGSDQITLTGSIANNGGGTVEFQSPLTINAASSTWSGGLNLAGIVNIGTSQVTLAALGTNAFTGTLNFDITDASIYGRFLGTGATSYTGAVTVNILGSYAGVLGNTFDFTTGNFTNVTLGALPTLTGGLTWNTTQFISNGILTVAASAIPEPSTYAALAGVLVLGMAVSRRRRSAA
jgi:hypothetical protein